MIRARLGNLAYWNEWTVYSEGRFQQMLGVAAQTSGDTNYRPQYVFEIAKDNYEQILRRYSRGDPISELPRYFPPLLDAWEQSEALGQSVWTEQQQYTRHAWAVNLDHYIVCFWLVGLALSLNIPDDQWSRLIALVGNEGEDELLDRVIASRSPQRTIGTKLCHPKPYQRLLKAVNASPVQQAQLLQDFVQHWYQDLNRPPKPGLSEMTAMYDRPYWYTYGNQNFEGGAYFGRWCVEAVAVVKAFGLDDRLCLGHEHYPGDLLRPGGSTTHHPQKLSPELNSEAGADRPAPPCKSWFKRWIGR